MYSMLDCHSFVFQFSIEETNQYIWTLCLPQLIKLSIRSRASAGQGASKTNALLQTNIWSPPLVYSYRFFPLLSATLPEVDHSSSVNFSREPVRFAHCHHVLPRARKIIETSPNLVVFSSTFNFPRAGMSLIVRIICCKISWIFVADLKWFLLLTFPFF